MTHSDVQNWLDKYVDAWRSEGTSKLTTLFTNDAAYRPSPWEPAVEGLAAISKYWDESRVGPNESFEFQSEIVALENNTAVVRVAVDNKDDTPSLWRDLWVVVFDKSNLCRSFEEWAFAPRL